MCHTCAIKIPNKYFSKIIFEKFLDKFFKQNCIDLFSVTNLVLKFVVLKVKQKVISKLQVKCARIIEY